MKVIWVTGGMLEIAERLAECIPDKKIKAKSITNAENKIVGTLSEVALAHIIQGRCDSTYDFDVIGPDGTTFEVKGKKSVVCRPGDEASVSAHNYTQKADFYAFLRVKPDYSKVALAGFYPATQYVKDAQYQVKGRRYGSNNFLCRGNCYNMFHRDLWDDYIKK